MPLITSFDDNDNNNIKQMTIMLDKKFSTETFTSTQH